MHTPRDPQLPLNPFADSSWLTLVLLALGGAAGTGPALAQSDAAAAKGAGVISGRLLVIGAAGLADRDFDTIARVAGARGGSARRIGNGPVRMLDVAAGDEEAVMQRLRSNPHVKAVERDRLVAPGYVTNDPYLGSAWHLAKVRASLAWDHTMGSGITIAVLDTGVDASHPDLMPVLVPGWNAFDNNSNSADVFGHGTKVAGVVAGAANNGVGVAGVAGAARVMPIRVSDASGYASYSAISSGLTWAADRGARVANISYVVSGSAAVASAASYFKSKGGLVATSAGNYGTDAGIAQQTTMIPVSATGSGDALASWSSYGAFVAVAAPGEGIYTTLSGGGYGAVSGTSFSSPLTAGIIALMMSARPSLSPATVESLLYSSSVDLGLAGRDPYYGHGRVDAASAVAAALALPSAAADTVAPTVSLGALASTVSGLVPVNATASDNVGVARVELWVNGVLSATDTAAPYAFTWDAGSVANGNATVQARAYDAAGNVGSSGTTVVAIFNGVDTIPPVISFLSPSSTTLPKSGNAQIKTEASDNAGMAALTQVLKLNGQVVASATGASLSYAWNTRKLGGGTYRFDATATDAAGNSTTTTLIVVKP